jgi:inosose dehydratase
MSAPTIAANPIPYWNRDGKVDKSPEVFAQAFADFAEIGFTAVKADVPEGMSAGEYAEWVAGYGLQPALSLFSSPFDTSVTAAGEVERARRFAADQTALGLDRTMVSSMAVPERMARPAVGAAFDQDRLDRAVDMCGEVCRALAEEGLRPLHHSHVGGVFETEAEIVALLDGLGADVIGIGPDTGHLRWAGIEPGPFIARYADRLGGMHLKDCFPDFLDGAPEADGRSYHELGRTKRLWAEPGRGVVDFEAVLAAVPEDYDGVFMMEIDEPSVATPLESHRIAFEWAQRTLLDR